MKKQRKRKYNPKKADLVSLNNSLKAVIDSVVFAWVPGINGVKGYTCEGVPINVSQDVHMHVMKNEHCWYVLCSLICRDSNREVKEEYIKSTEVICHGPIRHSYLANFLNQTHKQLLKTANDDHLMATAWIISPSGRHIDDKVMDKIYTHLGVWEFKSGYEWKNNTK